MGTQPTNPCEPQLAWDGGTGSGLRPVFLQWASLFFFPLRLPFSLYNPCLRVGLGEVGEQGCTCWGAS